MRYIKLAIPVLMILAISCNNMDSSKGQDDKGAAKKEFADPAAAAAAAKEDMMNAMDKVDFGVDKEKLRAAAPGAPVMKYDLDWSALLTADSTSSPGKITRDEPITLVPLVNGNDVVTIVSLMGSNGKYSIGSIGDKQIASELDMVKKVAGMQANIKIYQVPNLDAVIYAVGSDSSALYYTAYDNGSMRQGINAAALMKMLRSDAETFQKVNGDAMKKGQLVK